MPDPAGPWSDGVVMDAFGIDPDIAWDDECTCYVTMSGLGINSDGTMVHLGITQVIIDPTTGAALSEPTRLWSGTGGMFPEAPHLYRIGEWWYLMIAEGGTERGHSVTIARGASPHGPFEGAPDNPLVTARGSDRPVQNTGHGDLVQTPEGGWAMVLLGTRPRSSTRAFAPMGRETFITPVTWDDDGWPHAEPVLLDGRHEPVVRKSASRATRPRRWTASTARSWPSGSSRARWPPSRPGPGAARLTGRGSAWTLRCRRRRAFPVQRGVRVLHWAGRGPVRSPRCGGRAGLGLCRSGHPALTGCDFCRAIHVSCG